MIKLGQRDESRIPKPVDYPVFSNIIIFISQKMNQSMGEERRIGKLSIENQIHSRLIMMMNLPH